MIAYLEGSLLTLKEDRIILLSGQIGYEVVVPGFVMESLKTKRPGDAVALYIYHYQTEHQPRPVLIGFNLEAEREFFQQFISVEAIGPLKASKALSLPVRDIARAIESKNIDVLKRLNGIGERTAGKIIATLQGKMSKFALIREGETVEPLPDKDFVGKVVDVLVDQLGYRIHEANRLVAEALKRKPLISDPEALFEEVYRGETSNE